MRRTFYVLSLCLALILLSACGSASTKGLPPTDPDENSMFGIDKNINMTTIDNYVGRDDVAYIDVRMLFDPADYAAIGGEADLTRTITGFRVVPYPYIANLSGLPVDGVYSGECLFTLTWDDNGSIVSATPNYKESSMIINELFPKDKAIFLMCGGGGYAGMMKELLIFLGWDASLLYNVGANWEYNGENRHELVVYPELASDDIIYATWRADYAFIDFGRLHKVS